MKKDNNSKNLLDEILNSDEYIAYKRILEEKNKSVKTGKDVVHINYYKGILIEDDLDEYSSELQKFDLKLSSFDKNGVAYGSLEDYSNMISIVLNDELTKAIIYGVAGNFVWDSIKKITKKVFSKSKDKEIDSYTGKNKIEKKKITFGIDMSIDKNTGFHFRLDSEFTSETIDKPLDQATEFIKTQQPNVMYTHPVFLYYDHKKAQWIPIDVMEDIRYKNSPSYKIKGKRNKKK